MSDDFLADAVKSATQDEMHIDWDVPIQMDDGLLLRADVYRPLSDGPYAVIASHGPYAKGLTFAAGYPRQWEKLVENHPDSMDGCSGAYSAWELVDPEQWTAYGYAVVRIDSRGAGRSAGFVDVWSQREARDFYDCIEWIAAQPWSNGKVGLAGISYYAKNQWQVAQLRPPHLTAICPWEGSNDYYREMTHHGGIHNAFLPDWYRRISTIQYGLGSRGFRNPVSGLLASGDEDLTDSRCRQPLRSRRRDRRAPLRRRMASAHSSGRNKSPFPCSRPAIGADWATISAATSPRGSRPDRTEMARGARRHALGRLLHQYGRALQRRFFDYFLKGEGDWPNSRPCR